MAISRYTPLPAALLAAVVAAFAPAFPEAGLSRTGLAGSSTLPLERYDPLRLGDGAICPPATVTDSYGCHRTGSTPVLSPLDWERLQYQFRQWQLRK